MTKAKHQRTCEIQKSLETREKFPISYFDSRKYIQHNLALEDGLGPILALMDSLPSDRTKVTPLRSFEDGDHSVAHLDYVLGDWGPMVGFEVHRWEEDRIVEHWDNLQSTPASANPSGRSMVDGPVDVLDLELTEANKIFVRNYVDNVLIAGHLDRLASYFHGAALAQHSPNLPDGIEALAAVLAAGKAGGQGPCYNKLHKVLGQGNLVLTICEGTVGDSEGNNVHSAFYDLYRITGAAITEHWDVVEIIPPRAQWKNNNGKF